MQLDKMTAKHYRFLEKELNMSVEQFDVACTDGDNTVLEKLADDLMWIEADEIEACEGKEYSERGETVSELIDILYGPYDPEKINEPGADSEFEDNDQ